MKKIDYCKLHLSEVLFTLVSTLTIGLALYGVWFVHGETSAWCIVGSIVIQVVLGTFIRMTLAAETKKNVWKVYFSVFALLMVISSFASGNNAGFLGALLWGVLLLFTGMSDKTKEAQGPFLEPLNGDDESDPVPEPAGKLPYVYYDEPVEQDEYTIHYWSPYLGKEVDVAIKPRKERGKPFDKVRGIQVTDNLILLRSILFVSNFPGDIREMAKQYEGHLPSKQELAQIYAKFKEINQNLYECGEHLLTKRRYLYTTGDLEEDNAMNRCLDFATGQDSLADCDSHVSAVLVESLPTELLQAVPVKESSLGDEFDLLCEVDGQRVRLPFSKRTGKLIGIFPFKNEPEYLELDEVENKKHTDKDVDETRLLDERFFCCDRVSKVVNRLNRYLKKLNKPILEGSYLADNSSYMPGCGWIIGFDNTGDYHGGNVPAKLRYMGRFYGKCRN